MKIFYFSGATFPSPEAKAVHVVKMCEAFGKAGHDVTLFAKGNSRNDADIFRNYGIEGKFRLALAQHVNIPIVSGLVRLYDIPKQLKNLGKPDLVYGRDPLALALFAPRNIPVVFEAHQMPSDTALDMAISKLIKHPKFVGIVAISDALKQDLLTKYPSLKPERIFVAHDGADMPPNISGQVKEKKNLLGRENAFKIGYAGTLHPGKGLSMILRIAPLLPDFDFHIVGGSPMEVQRILQTNPSGNVIFYGYQQHADVAGYLSGFDVVLSPYQHQALIRTGKNISRWISPMKIFEYMAMQKPIVSSNLEVIREILENERNALLVPPGDPLAWVEAIKRLHQDLALRHKLGQQAFFDLKKSFTWETRAEAVLEFALGKRNSVIKPKLS